MKDDINELKSRIIELEKELDILKSNEQFKNIFNNLEFFIYVSDISTNEILFTNNIGKKLFGDIVGKICWQVFQVNKENICEFCQNDKLINENGEINGKNNWIIQNSKTNKWYNIHEQIIKWDNDKKVKLHIATDITSIKQIEVELRELNSSKDKFFSIIAHDLRNPILNSIGLLDLLKKNLHKYEIEKTERFIETIYNSAYYTSELLENLLVWANTQRGKMSYKPEEIQLNQLVDKKIKNNYQIVEFKNLKIINLIPENITVNADTNMLKTIFRNLMTNAIKFTNIDGEIWINAIETNNFIEISVKDTGIGMTENTINKLFKIDFSTSTKGTNEEKGTGLGLIICKEFIEKHGGKIWVNSELDKYTEFKFTIPI